MALELAAGVVLLVLNTLSLLTGVLTVRARFMAANPSAKHDKDAMADPPMDLKIFMQVFPKILCIWSSPAEEPANSRGSSEGEGLVAAKQSPLMDQFDLWRNVHMHATENNTAVAGIFFALYLAQQSCKSAGVDTDSSTAEKAMYVYLVLRIIHWLVYVCKIRQPFRAYPFVTSLAVLFFLVGQAVMWFKEASAASD